MHTFCLHALNGQSLHPEKKYMPDKELWKRTYLTTAHTLHMGISWEKLSVNCQRERKSDLDKWCLQTCMARPTASSYSLIKETNNVYSPVEPDPLPPRTAPSKSRCGHRLVCVRARHTVARRTSSRNILYPHPDVNFFISFNEFVKILFKKHTVSIKQ